MPVRSCDLCYGLYELIRFRYLHFQVSPALPPATASGVSAESEKPLIPRRTIERLVPNPTGFVPPRVAQWINCDIRSFDYSVLGEYVPLTHYLLCSMQR